MNLAACAGLPTIPVTGMWYRAADPRYLPAVLQTTHTAKIPSRFYLADATAQEFETLYLAENHLVALFEVQALVGSHATPVPSPARPWVIANVGVRLQKVVDLTDVTRVQIPLQTNAQELTGDWRGYQMRSPASSVNSRGVAGRRRNRQRLLLAHFSQCRSGVRGPHHHLEWQALDHRRRHAARLRLPGRTQRRGVAPHMRSHPTRW